MKIDEHIFLNVPRENMDKMTWFVSFCQNIAIFSVFPILFTIIYNKICNQFNYDTECNWQKS